MGRFQDLEKIEKEIAYDKGFLHGEMLEVTRLKFLQTTSIRKITHPVFGRRSRQRYKLLFGPFRRGT